MPTFWGGEVALILTYEQRSSTELKRKSWVGIIMILILFSVCIGVNIAPPDGSWVLFRCIDYSSQTKAKGEKIFAYENSNA